MNAHNRSAADGFTLTELAIVLGVAGLIIGAFWSALGPASETKKTVQASQQIMTAVQNIRESYMNAQGLWVSSGCTENKDVSSDLANLFPAEMRAKCGANTCLNSPFAYLTDGSLRITCTSVSGTIASSFRIVLKNLTPSSCMRMLTSGINYQDTTTGVTKLCGSPSTTPCSTATWSDVTCANGVCGIGAAPITQAQAMTKCGSGTSEVGWEFSVRK